MCLKTSLFLNAFVCVRLSCIHCYVVSLLFVGTPPCTGRRFFWAAVGGSRTARGACSSPVGQMLELWFFPRVLGNTRPLAPCMKKNLWPHCVAALFTLLFAPGCTHLCMQQTIDPVLGERLSPDYTVYVNGTAVPVLTSAVSIDAQEAPLRLNELYSFASFEMTEPVMVRVESSVPLTDLSVRSVNAAIPVQLDVSRPPLSCRPMAIISSSAMATPQRSAAAVCESGRATTRPAGSRCALFRPGRHEAGLITLSDNQTLYIDKDAVVSGRVVASGNNIRICGTGLLENSGEDYNWTNIILLKNCTTPGSKAWSCANIARVDVQIDRLRRS